jgi:hypothetical protein
MVDAFMLSRRHSNFCALGGPILAGNFALGARQPSGKITPVRRSLYTCGGPISAPAAVRQKAP